MALSPLADPEALCRQLKYTPTALQRTVLGQFERCEPTLDLIADEQDEVWRAVAMGVLWRVLRTTGTRALVIAAGDPEKLREEHQKQRPGKLGYDFMEFIIHSCLQRDPELGEITHPKSVLCTTFGTDPGWELRMVWNCEKAVRELAGRSQIGVILGAGDSEQRFSEARIALEDGLPLSDSLLIRVW